MLEVVLYSVVPDSAQHRIGYGLRVHDVLLVSLFYVGPTRAEANALGKLARRR